MTTNKAAAVVSEEQVELAAIALANVHRGHPNPKAYWAWMHEDEQAKYRERATAALQAALGVGGWRPIAEAPKDKQFFAADMHFDIGIAYWHEKNPYWGIPDRYEWVTSGWDDSPPPVYYLPSPPPSSEEG
jgi:hypothetical protein